MSNHEATMGAKAAVKANFVTALHAVRLYSYMAFFYIGHLRLLVATFGIRVREDGRVS